MKKIIFPDRIKIPKRKNVEHISFKTSQDLHAEAFLTGAEALKNGGEVLNVRRGSHFHTSLISKGDAKGLILIP